MDRLDLAIVIPAFCEERTIAEIVERVMTLAPVIVVDDGSIDNTSRAAKEAGAIVVRNSSNLGYEQALNRGFEEAARRGFENVITMDADGEHEPGAVQQFKEALVEEGALLVIGERSRKQRFMEIFIGLYFKRRFNVNDILCGMKGYHISLWKENECFDSKKLIGTELAYKALRKGASFCQIKVSGLPRQDMPRFGSLFSANIKIAVALIRILIMEFQSSIRD